MVFSSQIPVRNISHREEQQPRLAAPVPTFPDRAPEPTRAGRGPGAWQENADGKRNFFRGPAYIVRPTCVYVRNASGRACRRVCAVLPTYLRAGIYNSINIFNSRDLSSHSRDFSELDHIQLSQPRFNQPSFHAPQLFPSLMNWSETP